MAFLVCGEFCGESGLQKFGLCGIHPLTRRYMLSKSVSKKELKMILNHVSVGVSNVASAVAFYDSVLSELSV
ncbi:DUF3265 domain-containing protein, partial [Vibrio vulnificus]